LHRNRATLIERKSGSCGNYEYAGDLIPINAALRQRFHGDEIYIAVHS
jgi:hypothetical protein